jgi:hypothetical protein
MGYGIEEMPKLPKMPKVKVRLRRIDFNPTKKQPSLALLFLLTDLSPGQAQNTWRL